MEDIVKYWKLIMHELTEVTKRACTIQGMKPRQLLMLIFIASIGCHHNERNSTWIIPGDHAPKLSPSDIFRRLKLLAQSELTCAAVKASITSLVGRECEQIQSDELDSMNCPSRYMFIENVAYSCGRTSGVISLNFSFRPEPCANEASIIDIFGRGYVASLVRGSHGTQRKNLNYKLGPVVSEIVVSIDTKLNCVDEIQLVSSAPN